MIYEHLFLIALIKTIIIETVVLFLIIRLCFKKKFDQKRISGKQLLFAGIFCSFATLPYLWFIAPVYISSYFWFSVIGELGVFLLEGIMLKYILDISWKQAIILSFVANFASYGIGVLF